MYLNDIDKFTEKLNKIDDNTYVIEEEVTLINGIYEGVLKHDNVSGSSISIWTGPKLTGEKIENYILSTPSKMPWKKIIKIFNKTSKAYITYETLGDTVEAEDINKVQESIVNTQKALNGEANRAKSSEQNIENNLRVEIKRAIDCESIIRDNLNKESDRAIKENQTLTQNLNFEINRAEKCENNITNNLNNSINITNSNLNKEINRATDSENAISDKLNEEVERSKQSESSITNNLNSETDRAIKSEKTITDNLNNYKLSNNAEIQSLKEKDIDLNNKKSDKAYVDTELNKRYLKEQVFSKEEVLKKIQDVIGTAPEALDTLQEIAKSLNNDKDFAGTITKKLSDKVDKVYGKQLSSEDFTLNEKNKLAGVQNNANNYTHPQNHEANMIIENDSRKFVTSEEKVNWSDANSKKHTHNNLSLLESINHTLVNTWNTVTGKSDKGHKHGKNDISDFPSSMPASGGTSSFLGNAILVTDYNFLKPILIAQGNVTAIKAESSANSPWNNTTSGFLIQSNDSDSFHVLIFRSGGDGCAYRSCYQGKWGSWKIWSTFSGSYNDLYNKPNIPIKTSELTNDANFVTQSQLGSSGYGDMFKSVYDKNNNGKVDISEVTESIEWSNIKNKPSSFQPLNHNHDSSYLKKGKLTWNNLKGV